MVLRPAARGSRTETEEPTGETFSFALSGKPTSETGTKRTAHRPSSLLGHGSAKTHYRNLPGGVTGRDEGAVLGTAGRPPGEPTRGSNR